MPNLDCRLEQLSESMLIGDFQFAHSLKALDVMAALLANGVKIGDPIIYAGSVQSIVPAANLIRASQWNVAWLLTCDWEVSRGLMATYAHEYELIANIHNKLLPNNPGIFLYRVSKTTKSSALPENLNLGQVRV